MPFWRGIYTSIGDDQNISARLSTFTAHMSNLKRILDRAGPNDLVLLDEVAVGTEPTQGAALARAVLERLADCGAQVMVTTHYMALKAIAVEDNRFANAAMGFDSETMAPTYALEEGALGRSSAFSVARSLGLEEGLLARAEELLGGGGLRVDGLLAELEKQRRVLLENQQAVEAERAAAHREHEKAEKKRRTLAKELEALQKQTHDETVLELRSLRDELARMRKALRKGPKSVRRLEQGEAKATDAAKRLSALAPQEESPGGRPVRKGELREGDRVVVKKMGTLGKVISVDGRGGRATVQVGAVQMQTKVNELVFPPAGPRAPQTKAEKRKPEARRKPPVNVAPKHDAGAESEAGMDSAADAESVDPALFVRDPGATLDLRGMRVDEASEALDKFLDHMYGENRPAVLIIHGYGTGAVRKRVRQDLRRSPVVTRFRPGRRKEGGDGVTVAFFSE
jgi:DNA mismatch repair protein MutS2